MKKNKAAVMESEATKHGKMQILSSKRFSPPEKDFLRALLRDDDICTVSEAAQLLQQYLNQEAK